jgi:hypothetical protein
MMIHVDIYKREFSSRKESFFSPFFFQSFSFRKRKGVSLSERRKLQTPFLLLLCFPGTVLGIHQLESTAQAARQPRAGFSSFSFTIRISFISRYQTSKGDPPSRCKSSNTSQSLDFRRRRRLRHIKHRGNRRRCSQNSWRRRAYLCRSNRSSVSRCSRHILGSVMKMRKFRSKHAWISLEIHRERSGLFVLFSLACVNFV